MGPVRQLLSTGEPHSQARKRGLAPASPCVNADLGLPPRKPAIWWPLSPFLFNLGHRLRGGGREENGAHYYITSGKPFPLWLSGV